MTQTSTPLVSLLATGCPNPATMPPWPRSWTRAYRAFNARNVEGALAAMHPDVEWANGLVRRMEIRTP